MFVRRKLRRRDVLAGASAGALLAARGAAAMAIPVELAQPATLSPAAASGLFNNIALAGARLVAVGERGHILLSDDSGRNWRQAPVPVSTTLVSARFATPELGWVAGQMGVILKTTDAGETWRLVMNGFQAADLMLTEATADTAKAPADNAARAALQNAQSFVSFGASIPMLSLLPLSATHILVFGAYGLALESIDAGETWRGIAARVPDPQGLHIYAALQTAGALVAVGEQGLLLHGAPGAALVPAVSPYQGSLFGLVSLSPASIFAYGLQGSLLHSADQGATWQARTPISGNAMLSGAVLRDKRILLGDASGNLLQSGDAGASFQTLPGTLPVTALAQAPDGGLIIGTPAGLRRVTEGGAA
jgi:photosystem II stability/assembly factor-like uncharacterized protein